MKRFIALLCSLALVVSMLLALTCCVKDDGQKLPDDPDNGDQTPGGDENEGDNKDDGWGLTAFPGLSEQGCSYLSQPCASYLDHLMRHLPHFLSRSALSLPTLRTSM